MIQLLFLLLVLPALLGCLIKKLLRSNIPGFSGFFFILGFLVMVSEFAIICYVAIYTDTLFHIVSRITLTVYIIESLGILFWLVMSKRSVLSLTGFKDKIITLIHSPAFWYMAIVCTFQIVRLVVMQPYQFRDSKTYNALVIDTLQTDHLFRTFQTSGFPFASVLYMKLRFTLSPWYPFQAMLSGICKLHPLIICNTVMPAYILLLEYILLYSLGKLLFNNDRDVCLFTALCAFVHELTLYCHTPTMINLVWPLWGKGVVSCIIVPILLILFIMYARNYVGNCFSFFAIVFFIGLAGCSMSPMAGLVIPLELSILGLIQTVRTRSIRPLFISIASCCPSFIYLGAYYYLSHLQQLV